MATECQQSKLEQGMKKCVLVKFKEYYPFAIDKVIGIFQNGAAANEWLAKATNQNNSKAMENLPFYDIFPIDEVN